MNTRRLGRSGPALTEVGLGAWAIGGPGNFGWGKTDDTESVAAIHAAIDAGINWIDTAAVYGLGHSERIIGKALAGKRDSVFIATKCGQVWDDTGQTRTDNSPTGIRKEMEESLRRLRTDHVDLYQIHWPDRHTPVEDTWQEMVRLRDEGKTRYIGVCNFGVDLLQRCLMIDHVQSLQPIYNLIERDIEKEILPYCVANEIGVVAYSPMQHGLLTETFDRSQLAADDWRIVHSDKFREPKYSQGLRAVEKLGPIARKYGKSVGQLAVAWVLLNPAVTSAIVGARKRHHVRANAGASGWSISEADLDTITGILDGM